MQHKKRNNVKHTKNCKNDCIELIVYRYTINFSMVLCIVHK